MATVITRAPELHASLHWLNGERQTLASHRGQVCLLLFWNAASPWCQTLIDSVVRLQGRHPADLTVLAIHQPKFDAEQDDERVLRAAQQSGLQCPVANDHGWVAWQHFQLSAWPSIVLVDAAGNMRRTFVGDQPGSVLESAIEELLSEPEVSGGAQAMPRRARGGREGLCFPSGLAATDKHVYVADSGNHRILECNHEGRVLRQFGSGQGELVDGNSDEAGFRGPRGLRLTRDWLYVADTGNHALRRIHLVKGEVETLIGNGRVGQPREGGVDTPASVCLNQPWDVVVGKDRLFIALAGCNQIWDYDLKQKKLHCLAGSGELGIADGPARTSFLAHPAGLALVEQNLYFADSASSAVRVVHLANNAVETLVGQGLYEFGLQNGIRSEARLQYPLAVALDPQSPVLWVADAYNQRLRRLRLGGGEMLEHELPGALEFPCALASVPGSLFIADAHAHAVYRLDTASGEFQRLPIGE